MAHYDFKITVNVEGLTSPTVYDTAPGEWDVDKVDGETVGTGANTDKLGGYAPGLACGESGSVGDVTGGDGSEAFARLLVEANEATRRVIELVMLDHGAVSAPIEFLFRAKPISSADFVALGYPECSSLRCFQGPHGGKIEPTDISKGAEIFPPISIWI